MAGDISLAHRAAFKDLLYVAALRGRDSTGVIKVNGGNTAQYLKALGTPEGLLEMKSYDREIDTHGTKILVGHCRAKTFGTVSRQNAHPFHHDHILGVHNGTLRAHYTMRGANSFDVDSDFLYSKISEEGIDEAMKEMQGAWALVWWNDEEKTLNFLRNDERPLWFAYTKDKRVMLWASEIGMFWAFSRKHELFVDDKGKSFFQLPEHQLQSYKINAIGKEPKDIFNLSVREIKPKEPEVRGYAGNSNNHGWIGGRFVGNNYGGGRSPGVHSPAYVGPGTHNQGGEVSDPFSTKGIGSPESHFPHLAEKARQEALQSVNTLAESMTTPNSGVTSSASSLSRSASTTGPTSSINTPRPKLSLVSPSSKDSLLARNGKLLNEQERRLMSCETRLHTTPLVSVRNILGSEYIADTKTNREFTLKEFDDKTTCVCCFCKSAIGDLSEVSEIFVLEAKQKAEELVTFICNRCTIPAVA